MDEDVENPRFLPLHRFHSAEWSGEDAFEPKDFSIDKYLEENKKHVQTHTQTHIDTHICCTHVITHVLLHSLYV